MHYFLLVIFHTGTHLVTPIPLSCFPEGQFDLLSEWHALFLKGILWHFKKSHGKWTHFFFFFFNRKSMKHLSLNHQSKIYCLVDVNSVCIF